MADKPTKLEWTDSEGRNWSTFLDIPHARALKDAGYDLKDHERFAKVLADPYDAADFIVAFHRPGWEALGLSELDFLAVITETEGRLGEVLEAVVAGLVDFFHRFRDGLRANVLAKALMASKRADAEIDAKLNSSRCDEAIDAGIKRALGKVDEAFDRVISGEIYGNSSENSAFRQTD